MGHTSIGGGGGHLLGGALEAPEGRAVADALAGALTGGVGDVRGESDEEPAADWVFHARHEASRGGGHRAWEGQGG